MKKISFSAPGSIILSGNIGMKFGKPALAAAIGYRITAHIVFAAKDAPQEPYINKAKKIILEYLNKNSIRAQDKPFAISWETTLPRSGVWGYKQAMYCALIASLLTYYSGREYPPEIINQLAHALEKKSDRRADGLRTSVSCFGGLIYYRREFEFLRNASLLNMKVPKIIQDRLFVLETGNGSLTVEEMENKIGKLYNKSTVKTAACLSEMEKNTKQMVLSLLKEDGNLFMDSVHKSRQILDRLKVTPESKGNVPNKIRKIGKAAFIGDGYMLVHLMDTVKNPDNIYRIPQVRVHPFIHSIAGVARIR